MKKYFHDKIKDVFVAAILISQKREIFLLAALSLWVLIGLFLGLLLPAIIFPGYYDVDLSYDSTPTANFILFSIMISFILSTIIVPPSLVFAISKFFTHIANRWRIEIWHLWASLLYLLLTISLIMKATFSVISLILLFSYLLLGIAFTHFLAYSYRENIKPIFYKYLEYIYVIVAAGGIISAAPHIDVLHEKYISKLEYHWNEVTNELNTGSCDGRQPPDTCYEVDDLESREKEINELKNEKPLKITAILHIYGYMALTIAIMLKFLKISGEIFNWHNKRG